MVNEFYTKHKERINQAIKNKSVQYSMGANNSATITVHNYYIEKNDISITVYAKYDKKIRRITGYSATVTILSEDGKEQMQDKNIIAERLYKKLSAKHSAQIAKTCLNSNFINRAFCKKR